MNGKAVWTVPAVTFGPGAALLVTFLARAVVRLLLAKLPPPPVPLAVRAADSGAGLDFLRNSVVVAAAATVADSSPLEDTEVSTVFWVPGNKLPVLVAAPVHFLGRREVRSTLEGVLEKAPVDTEGEVVDERSSRTLWNCGEPLSPGDR